MHTSPSIQLLSQLTPEHIAGLSGMMQDVVEDGASIGFLPPLSREEAEQYWRSVPEPGVFLWAAVWNGRIVGTVQLQLAMKKNAAHRAEIAKLMVHPSARRHGIARSLMHTAHEQAKQESRSLLLLDTRAGDPSNELYKTLGYTEAGRIPGFARSSEGGFDATIIYYLNL
ncbi:GNAT family N-acetyltransferase [Paenibacillus sp. 1011MAR3C5]|uniref:GNAT family N-acetyltransferase n=1 Tax=Paenibacillus sp. 1011MAR3C5 TaxID=1675787 RepID=UPI000E6D2D4F|nr:GNAT family N-acetyltransferase [Paenibacillus sp. 1011MAR3C5]RJE86901.1 GNAT family N-acetyltransferase [Paenibacillus sp. 1011MAR3C5]